MARKKPETQLRLFGVGDLGPPGEADGVDLPDDSYDERWDAVYRHLGRILGEEGFEAYLARRRLGEDQSTGG